MTESTGKTLNPTLLSAVIAAVVGVAAALITGLLTTTAAHDSDAAQAQQQVEATRRQVYADLMTAAADVCNAITSDNFDPDKADAASSVFIGRLTAVYLVAPDDVYDKAEKLSDYIDKARKPTTGDGKQVPTGCRTNDFADVANNFLHASKEQLHD